MFACVWGVWTDRTVFSRISTHLDVFSNVSIFGNMAWSHFLWKSIMVVIAVNISGSFAECGWWGPSSGNISYEMIPLGVCGNYGAVLGDTDKSVIYECNENGILYKKVYDEHGCNSDDVIEDPMYGFEYECDSDSCHGHLVLETYAQCTDFESNSADFCSCAGSTVEILNTNTCILSLDGSYKVMCDSTKATYIHYSDRLCTNQTGDLEYKPHGCYEPDAARYGINLCSGCPSMFVAAPFIPIMVSFLLVI